MISRYSTGSVSDLSFPQEVRSENFRSLTLPVLYRLVATAKLNIQHSTRKTVFSFRLPRNVIALGLVSLFNDASSEIIYPLLPVFMTSTLGASLTFVGVIEGLAESVSSLLKLPAGWLSDRLGRRKVIVVAGYGLAAVMRPLLPLVTSAWQVLGLRFVDRIGKGLRSAPRDAMIADAAGREARGLAFGFHRAMDHAGAIVGSLISAWLIILFHDNYRRVFWAASVPAFLGLFILLFAVRDPRPDPQANSPTLEPSSVPLRPLRLQLEFKKYLGVLFLFTLSNSSDAFLLLRAKQRGLSDVLIPLLWALLHVSKSLSSVVGGGLSDRFGRKRLIVSGWVLYAAIYFGFRVRQHECGDLVVVYGLRRLFRIDGGAWKKRWWRIWSRQHCAERPSACIISSSVSRRSRPV